MDSGWGNIQELKNITFYHGSDREVRELDPYWEDKQEIKHRKENGPGFYLLFEKSLYYAVLNALENRTQNIVINEYELDVSAMAADTSYYIYSSFSTEYIDYVKSNLLAQKLTTCSFSGKECQSCNYKCPKNAEIICSSLIDYFLDDTIIRSDGSFITEEQLENLIHQAMFKVTGEPLKQLRISPNLYKYIKWQTATTYNWDNPEIQNFIANIKRDSIKEW